MESPIEKILDFLFSNIWVLIIIGGIVLNIFKRLNGQHSEPTTQIPIPKPFRTVIHEEKETHPEVFSESEELSEAKPEPIPTIIEAEEPANSFYEKYLELQAKGTQENGVTSPERSISVPLNKREINPKIKAIKRNKVIEGIIWAEVLGPPRSKRPYKRSNYLS